MRKSNGGAVMTRPIAIVGAGGFAREVLWLLADIGVADRVSGFYETDAHWHDREIAGLPVRPASEIDAGWNAVVAVGDPAGRIGILSALPAGLGFPTFVHPAARIGPRVELGEGTIVCAGSILTCDIGIGRHVHLNIGTTVGHDCIFGDFVTTAPAVNVSGRCALGRAVYIGTNACLREGLHVPESSVIGMGAVLVGQPDGPGTYVGNPARKR